MISSCSEHSWRRWVSTRVNDFERAPQIAHKAEDHDLWMAFFRDVDGNLLALESAVPQAQP